MSFFSTSKPPRLHGLLSAGLLGLSALGLAAAAPEAPGPNVPAPQLAELAESAPLVRPLVVRSNHVIVVSLDGLRPDAIEKFGARTLLGLMREGTYSLQAQTTMPSITLPSHTSMLTGVDPEQHGITWNNDQTEHRGTVEVPTVFSLARSQGLRTAAFFSKTKFHHLQVEGSLDFTQAPETGKWSAGRTIENVEQYLRSGARPNLMFVHIGEADYAGHFWGWMSWMYGRGVRKADDAVESIVEEADRAFGRGNYTLIVTSDHGGSGHNHGSSDPRDTTIPWIAWGKSVRAQTELAPGIRTMDTAATALWLLGITPPEDLLGRPVAAGFQAPTMAGR